MRILSVVDGIGWGGTKEQTYLLARELSKKGIEVHMALSFQYTQMVEKLKPYGVKFHFFENHNKFSRFNPANYYRLWKTIKEGNFDIVIANSPHALDFVRVVWSFLKRKPKLIAYKRTGRSSSWLSKKLKYSVADAIVVVDKRTYEKLFKEGFYSERLIYIPSGIDLSRFRPLGKEARSKKRAELGIEEDMTVFINVANWIPHHKGQPLLIEAFSRLNCDRCLLVLAGIDTEKEAVNYARRFGIARKVLGLGFREDIPELLNMADFFVFASYFEGIAGAVLQAMACGKVVVSTLAGGIKDYLVDGVNGISAQVGSVESLLEAMERALKLSQLEKVRLSEEAIKTARLYSIERTVEEYIKLFERLKGSEHAKHIPVSSQ